MPFIIVNVGMLTHFCASMRAAVDSVSRRSSGTCVIMSTPACSAMSRAAVDTACATVSLPCCV